MLSCLPLLFALLPMQRPVQRDLDRQLGDHEAAPTVRIAPIEIEWIALGALPTTPTETIEVDFVLEGRPDRLLLRRHSLRAPGALVRLIGTDGRAVDLEPPPVQTYRGVVRGEPGSTVLASWTPNGLEALIVRATGERFRLEPARLDGPDAPVHPDGRVRPESLLHTVRPEPVPEAFACGSDDHEVAIDPGFAPRVGQELPPRCLVLAQIAFDADFEYFQAKGSSSANVVAAIDAVMNQVEFFYARDVQITYALTAYVVRTAPFYTPTSGGTLLEQFRAEWNTNQTSITRDIAHLMTGKPGSLIEFGGLAYVGVVCTSSQYGWSMDGANIVGHEVGHNWGAGHCHDVSPCNNMCGACFYVGPNTRSIITAFRDSRTCLERVSNPTTPVPPYAYPDGSAARKDAVDTLGSIALDVLANDQDGNCTPVALAGFDTTSELGGTIRHVTASPFDTHGILEYTLPANPFVGRDRFAYAVTDGIHVTPGEVTVDLAPLEVTAWWPLDEGAGNTAGDVTGRGFDGTVSGTATWTTGQIGSGLVLNGINNAVSAPPLALDSNQVTITAWIWREGAQTAFSGLVFSRGGSTVAGLHFGPGNQLRYNWNGDPATYDFDSGLTIPAGRWIFTALVVEPDQATLWTKDGATLASSTNAIRHPPEAFDGPLWLGRDPNGNRFFHGRLDDVRVYAYALTQAELEALTEDGGPAEAPYPRDGGKLVDPNGALAWLPNAAASQRQVYFGTQWAAVRDASPASAEFLGTIGTTSVAPGPLAAGQTYYWRVDELAPAALRGHVWQFALADFHRWPLDETSGTTAFDANGTLHGTYLAGVLLNQPGATPSSGTSVSFDGINDRIQIPALNLDSNRVTITTWLRRNGSQSSFAGLVFSRTANTVAGLNFGDTNELRYHWNGDSSTWGWNSGLVPPDDQWVFVALVVEPGRARMHLGSGGSLSTAINTVSHAAEEFDSTLTLGRDPTSSARSFRGLLDDVRVYDHALTEAEVLALYLGS